MKSKSRTTPRAVAVGTLIAAFALPVPTLAQGTTRAGSYEFLLPLIYSESENFSGPGGSSANLNADMGMGFGFAYNVNNHFQLSGAINWNTRNFDATLVNTDGTTRRASGTLDTSTIMLNATFYFAASGLAPFVSGGIGSTLIDTNIPTGQITTACWWDPYWGYICNDYTPTKSETVFSYTAGAGLRWELTRSFALQGGYNRMWIDLSEGTSDFGNWRFDLVFRM